MMDPIVIWKGRADARQNKNSGTMEPFRRQVKAADCSEIPSFEYKLRVRGTEKGRKQRLANGRCGRKSLSGRGQQRLRHMTAAGAAKISRGSFIYVGDIIVGRWRVTADRWSSPALSPTVAATPTLAMRSRKTVSPTLCRWRRPPLCPSLYLCALNCD